MIILDIIPNNSNNNPNEKWPYIPDYSYRILIIRIKKNKYIA